MLQQLRVGGEIPIRIGDVRMAEIRREGRHLAFDLAAGTRPAQQRLGRKAVSQVVQARSTAHLWCAQPHRARDRVEGQMKLGDSKLGATAGQQEVRTAGTAPRKVHMSTRGVLLQRPHGRGMQWDETGLRELAAADGDDARLEIDVLAVHAECFADAQPRHGEKSDERRNSMRLQRLPRGQGLSCRHQCFDLLLGVEVRLTSLRSKREQSCTGDLGGGLEALQIARELPNDGEPSRPGGRARVRWRHRPPQRKARGQHRGALLLHEGTEVDQIALSLHQAKAEPTAQGEVVAESIPGGAHSTPPGQGSASVLRRTRSTFAYRRVVSSSRWRNRYPISRSEAPLRSISVASVCRKMCVPLLGASTAALRMACLTMCPNASLFPYASCGGV